MSTLYDCAHGQRSPSAMRRDLRAIVGDGASFSVMVGLGETYLPAFALAAGMGEVAAGLVATVPLLAGAIVQLSSPWGVRLLKSNRRWVVLCAATQAASFLPLLAAVLLGRTSTALVFCCASIYWAGGMAAGPAWNTWVGTLVPERLRARYFARRTRASQAGVFVGFVAGGLTLQAGQTLEQGLRPFAVLFLTASICRFISAAFLASQREVASAAIEQRRVPWRDMACRLRHGKDGRLLVYLLAMQASVQVSSAYFTPFMLRHLDFSYTQFVMMVGVSYAAKAIALPTLGRFAHRFGARALLRFGGLGIIPLAGMWLLSQNFAYLLAVQALGGVTWAAYELAMFLLFFEAIPQQERTSVLTTYNFAHAVATVAGSLAGASLLGLWGEAASTYLTIFGVSSLLRLSTLALLARVPASAAQPVVVMTRTLAVRPSAGSFERPILPSAVEADEAATESVVPAPHFVVRHSAEPSSVAVRSA